MKRLHSPERREQILRSAICLFSKQGFRGTKTRDIAQKAGISEALLFKHFPDKQSLYEAILTLKMEEKVPLILSLLDNGPPQEVLKKIALKMVEQHEKDPDFLKLLYFSVLEGHELSDLLFQKKNLPIRDHLETYIRREVKKGTLRQCNPKKTSFAFMALISGYIMTRIFFRIPEIVKASPASFINDYIDIFLKGILT